MNLPNTQEPDIELIPVQAGKLPKFEAVPGHLVLPDEGRGQAFRAGEDSRPIARAEVAVACKKGAVAGRHVAYSDLVGMANTEGTLGWLAKSRDL